MTAIPSSSRSETMSLAELVGYIVSHYHARLRQSLPELIAVAQRVDTSQGGELGGASKLTTLLTGLQSGMLDHLMKEERVVFPMILQGDGPRAGGPIRVMATEHGEYRRVLAELRELTRDRPSGRPDDPSAELNDRLQRFASELAEHLALEEDVLFTRAITERADESLAD